MSNERFQVIVVGAGPAGCAAAYRLAQAGLEVLLIDRGKNAGSKNVTGGRIYSYALEQLMPGEWQQAPLEREVSREMIMMMTKESSITINSQIELPNLSYTVLRAKLDEWLAGKAEEAGAMLATGFTVESLLVKDGKVYGVKAGDEELEADIVICADGVNSLLAERSSLAKAITAENTAVGIKQVFALPEQVINDRFGLAAGKGASCLMVGACTQGLSGGGFLYTNKESLSIGIVVDSAAVKQAKISVVQLIDQLNEHPAIAPLIDNGELLEYSAHLIPEGGIKHMPQLYGNGYMIVGDAAGLVVNSGLTVRGMDYAILSGIAAAETAVQAIEAQEYSSVSLKSYQSRLTGLVLKDMETFKKAHEFMSSTPALFTTYPELAESMIHNVYKVDGSPAKRLPHAVKASLQNVSLMQLVKEGIKGAMSI